MSASMCASPPSLLAPDTAVPFPVPGSLQRVHRVHHVPGGDQRRDPRAAVGLDPDHHLRVIRRPRGRCRPISSCSWAHPGRALGQPPLRQHLPGLVHHLDVVMILGPVITHDTAAPALPSAMSKHVSSQRENHQQPNKTVLTPPGGHDIPAAINSPGHRQGHGLSSGLNAQEPTSAHLPAATSNRVCRMADPLTLIRTRDVRHCGDGPQT